MACAISITAEEQIENNKKVDEEATSSIKMDEDNLESEGCSGSRSNDKEEEISNPLRKEKDVEVRRRQILKDVIIKRLLRSAALDKCGMGGGGCFRPDHCARMCAIHCRRMGKQMRQPACMQTCVALCRP